MDTVKKLVDRAEAYAVRNRIALATLSHRIFNEGKRLDRLKRGISKITTDRLADADARLAALEAAELSLSDTS